MIAARAPRRQVYPGQTASFVPAFIPAAPHYKYVCMYIYIYIHTHAYMYIYIYV